VQLTTAAIIAGLGILACAAGETAAAPAAGTADRFIPARAPGWPQWRGPRRNGVSDETGLLSSWPQGGPKLLWTAEGIGKGWSSPVFSGDRIYITGDVGKELHVFALTLDGKPKWKAANGKAWFKPHGGARSSCTYDDGRLFHMNAYARLVCFNAEVGKELWTVDLLKKFEAKKIYFGFAESVIVDANRVIATPGGKKGTVVCLDKKTGQTIWAAGGQSEEAANYSSAILVELGGRRQVIACGAKHTFAIDADKGKVLWSYPHAIKKSMSTSIPVLHKNLVFITNSCREYGTSYCLQIDTAGRKAKKIWTSKLDNSHGSVVTVGGRIYSASRRKLPGWVCVDFETGKTRYVLKDVLRGSTIYADGRLYRLTQTGTVMLMKPTDKGFETTGQFELIKGKKDTWAHPVICSGKLYLRYHDKLYCYDIRKR